MEVGMALQKHIAALESRESQRESEVPFPVVRRIQNGPPTRVLMTGKQTVAVN